jgi:hypothetical protein
LNKCKLADKHLDPSIAVMEKTFRETVETIKDPKAKLDVINNLQSGVVNPVLVRLGLRER